MFVIKLFAELLDSRGQHLFMDCSMTWIYMFERPWRQHNRFLVKNFNRRRGRSAGRKTDSLGKSCAHKLDHNLTLVPPFEGAPAHFYVVNFNAFLDALSEILEKRLARLQLIENSVCQVHAQDADGLLFERVGRISQVDMENDLVRLAPRLQLEPQADPTVGLIRSRIVAGGDGINK